MGTGKGDPVYEAFVRRIFRPYVDEAKKWWEHSEYRTFVNNTTCPVKDSLPGFFEKCARSPRQSAVQGVQAFPCVLLSYLQFPPNMPGGAVKYVDHLCKEGFEIDEYTLLSRFGCNSSDTCGCYIPIVPTRMWKEIPKGRWVYMRATELLEISAGILSITFIERLGKLRAKMEELNEHSTEEEGGTPDGEGT